MHARWHHRLPLLTLALPLTTSAAPGGQPKADVCHWTAGEAGYVLIRVATNSAHFDPAKHPDDVAPSGWYPDADGDGFGDGFATPTACPGGLTGYVDNDYDCDDSDASVSPVALENPYDGVDNDCDAETADDDLDGDGYALADDCDDSDPWVNPSAGEIPYDGIDNDCDAGTPDDDIDGDSYGIAQDCDDVDPDVNPDAEEVCEDGVDNDCTDGDATCAIPAPSNCTSGTFGGKTYFVCQGSKNYYQAEQACTDLGMGLSHIDSGAENTFVVDLALRAYGCVSYSTTSYWVSNVKSTMPAGSTWSDTHTAVWHAGEPNGDGNNVHLMRYCDNPYGWNDVPTTYTWGWVCESL
ncbi:MAG TPA: MopE-related protein [Myxococcota bacterium]|nr:MopE-related protein [Myxococcota bacterium]